MPDALVCLSSMAPREILRSLAGQYEELTGAQVAIEAMGGIDAVRAVRSGRAADIVVLASNVMAELEAEGHILSGSLADFARSGMAIAVRKGAERPDVGDGPAVKRAIMAAGKVGYSTGPSGDALLRMCDRWGLLPSIADRMIKAPAGVPVGSLLASGEVDLAFQQLSELVHVDGIDVVGPLPPDIQVETIFTAALRASSSSREAARALLAFLTSPAADPAKREHGMTSA